tara:strand:- start:193 stop:603 length:411 start_codon:yes stop_codon:yes gene_type:complete
VDEDSRLCLQLRDERNDIFFPGLWGLFGGSVESNENPSEALCREIEEELEIKISNFEKILTVTIDFALESLKGKKRHFFLVRVTQDQKKNMKLNEGQRFEFFDIEDIPHSKDLAPVDACGIIYCCHAFITKRKIIP